MSCDCIEEFNKLIREKSGDEKASVNIAFNLSRDSGKLFTRPSMSCQWRDKKKDGTFTKEHDHPISTGQPCPACDVYDFCGGPQDAPASNFLLALALEYATQPDKQRWQLDRERVKAILDEHLYCARLASAPKTVPMAMLTGIAEWEANSVIEARPIAARYGFTITET